MVKKPMTIAGAKMSLKKMIRQHEQSFNQALDSGDDESAYYEGLLDAYGVALAMLTQIEPDTEEDH